MFPFIESNCHCINWICSFQALSTTALLQSKANWWLGSQLVQQRFRCNCLSKWLWRYADSGTFKGAEVLFLNMASYNIVHQHGRRSWFWTRDWQHQRSLTRLRQYWWGAQKTWQKKSLLPPKASAEGGLYLKWNWLLWSVYDGLLWSVYDGLLWISIWLVTVVYGSYEHVPFLYGVCHVFWQLLVTIENDDVSTNWL